MARKHITFAGSTIGEPWWSLGEIVADVLKPYRPIALFHYYDSSGALFGGINWGDVEILLALTALLFIISVLAFQRRDIAV